MSSASARFLFLLSSFFFSVSAFAQSVRWEPAAGSLAQGKVSELQLIFEDCSPSGEPALPATPELSLQRVGQSESTSITNGTINRSVILTFAATPQARTQIVIPSFSVATDKGPLAVPAATYEVGDATVGRSNLSLDSVAKARFEAPAEVWAGQVFPLRYELSIARRYFDSLASNLEWSPAPLVINEWPKPQAINTVIDGESHVTVIYQTQALAQKPGPLSLQPSSQITNLITGTASMGFFGPQNRAEPFIIKGTPPAITVKPLPSGAPASFAGAVGQFVLESKLVPETATPGEPVTWTLTLRGTGNWPDVKTLPSRSVAKSFRVVSPDAKRTPKEGTLFDASLSEDIVLVPTQPGNYNLGPITWSYFDPAKGTYVPITTPAHTLIVKTPAVAPTSVNGSARLPSGSDSHHAAQPATQTSAATPKLPAAPQTLPRTPLAASDLSPTPLSTFRLILFAAAPLLVLPLVWLALAYRHARRNDPDRHRRAAYQRLKNLLARSTLTSPELQAWQADALVLLNLRTAAPSSEQLAAAFAASTQGETWKQLWREAEATLYRADTALAPDWPQRAQLALSAYRISAFSFTQVFQTRNLLPFAAALALSLAPSSAKAADPLSDYAAGKFSSVEKSWRDELKKSPTDSALRHNLSLALSQQNRWGEAAAHAAAATLQNPASDTYRAQLSYTLNQAGYLPTLLTDISRSTWSTTTTALLSPAQWQHVLIASTSTLVLGLALLLASRYFAARFTLRLSGQILAELAVIGFAHASLSLWQYGPLKDTRAALVWKTTTLRSIPTDTNAEQKTSPLEAGHVVIIERTFLTWSHLQFPDGKTGWVRSSELVSLWK